MTPVKPERAKYIQDWETVNYDRVLLRLPKGTKDRITANTGESINGYIKRLVLDDLDRIEAGNKEE